MARPFPAGVPEMSESGWRVRTFLVRTKGNGKWSREICYAVTSLTVTQASHAGAAGIAAALRYHARRPGRPLQTIMKC